MDWPGPSGIAEYANERLALISPRSPRQRWLHAYWEPGEDWMPIHRLVVAQMTPRAVMAKEYEFYKMLGESGDASKFFELEGPNPRESGYYDNIKEEFVYRAEMLPPNITQRQWLLWRSEQAYAEPIWIVQGSHGGHKRRFSNLEGVILRKYGRPREAPLPGTLPFAQFDDRILDALRRMSDLQAHFDALMKWAELRPDEERAEYKKSLTEEARIEEEILAWLDPQIEDVAA
jgi:hypothetical protein